MYQSILCFAAGRVGGDIVVVEAVPNRRTYQISTFRAQNGSKIKTDVLHTDFRWEPEHCKSFALNNQRGFVLVNNSTRIVRVFVYRSVTGREEEEEGDEEDDELPKNDVEQDQLKDKVELDETKKKLERTIKKLGKTKDEATKKKLEQTKEELEQAMEILGEIKTQTVEHTSDYQEFKWHLEGNSKLSHAVHSISSNGDHSKFELRIIYQDAIDEKGTLHATVHLVSPNRLFQLKLHDILYPITWVPENPHQFQLYERNTTDPGLMQVIRFLVSDPYIIPIIQPRFENIPSQNVLFYQNQALLVDSDGNFNKIPVFEIDHKLKEDQLRDRVTEVVYYDEKQITYVISDGAQRTLVNCYSYLDDEYQEIVQKAEAMDDDGVVEEEEEEDGEIQAIEVRYHKAVLEDGDVCVSGTRYPMRLQIIDNNPTLESMLKYLA